MITSDPNRLDSIESLVTCVQFAECKNTLWQSKFWAVLKFFSGIGGNGND